MGVHSPKIYGHIAHRLHMVIQLVCSIYYPNFAQKHTLYIHEMEQLQGTLCLQHFWEGLYPETAQIPYWRLQSMICTILVLLVLGALLLKEDVGKSERLG